MPNELTEALEKILAECTALCDAVTAAKDQESMAKILTDAAAVVSSEATKEKLVALLTKLAAGDTVPDSDSKVTGGSVSH